MCDTCSSEVGAVVEVLVGAQLRRRADLEVARGRGVGGYVGGPPREAERVDAEQLGIVAVVVAASSRRRSDC